MGALEVLRDDLEKRMEPLQEAILSGVATDYAAYKSMVGELKGLRLAYQMTLPLKEAKKNESVTRLPDQRGSKGRDYFQV